MLRLKFTQHSLYHGKQPFLLNTVEKADEIVVVKKQ